MDKNADMAASMQSRQLTGNIVWGQKLFLTTGGPSGGALHETVVVQTKVSGIS